MQIVPAPSRQFKTYSMLLGIFIGSFDALVLLLKTFGDIHIMSPTTVLAVNAVLGFLIVPAKLILQNIPATNEQKKDMVEHVASQPMQPGESDVSVKIDNTAVPQGDA